MIPRITVTPVTEEDIEFIVDLETNASLWPYEDRIPTDKAAVRKEVTERIGSDWHKQYLIRLNAPEATIIGELTTHWYVHERDSWELGFCLFPKYRGQGYCGEVARMALKVAFEEWKAHRVIAMCNSFNTASAKVLEGLGMVREGIFREELNWNGQWVDQYFYAILEREYQKVAATPL